MQKGDGDGKVHGFKKISIRVLPSAPQCHTACLDHHAENMARTQVTRHPSIAVSQGSCALSPLHRSGHFVFRCIVVSVEMLSKNSTITAPNMTVSLRYDRMLGVLNA